MSRASERTRRPWIFLPSSRLLLKKRAPSLWILDEPYDALDTQGVEAVNGLLADHLARQGSVLLTSHLPLNLLGPVVHELDLQSGTLS